MSQPEWIVGFHAVLAAMETHAERVEIVWLADASSGLRAKEILAVAKAKRLRYASVSRRELDFIAQGVAHNGFAVRLSSIPFADPDMLLDLPSPVCLVGLDTLEDPHNLGAAIRVAAGLGLGGVVVSGPHPPPMGGAVAKVAAGTMALVPIAHVGALGDFALAAKKHGFWVWGAETDGEPLGGQDLPDRLLLCFGAEATGLRAKTKHALDVSVAIPLAAGVESLNLSVAVGIMTWTWRQQFPLAKFAIGK